MTEKSSKKIKHSLKGNVGEWSELYVFLKLMADGKLDIGNEELQKREDGAYYPIIAVKRKEKDRDEIEYVRIPDKNAVRIIQETEIDCVPIEEFEKAADIIYEKIKNKPSRTFEIPEIEEFIERIHFEKLKADNRSKADIELIIYDSAVKTNLTLGFSIKSYLGSSPTLFNASKQTNITYIIPKLDDNTAKEIMKTTTSINEKNEESHHVKERIQKIIDMKFEIEFEGIDNKTFEGNLKMIDTQFPQMIAQLLLLYYSKPREAKVKPFIKIMRENDICGFQEEFKNPIYEYKMKNFLMSALGMVAETPWDGKTNATGGYITIEKNGELICTHDFEEYLYNNTKFDTADTSKHEFGKLYIGQDKQYRIKLNLQIRYTK